MRCNEMSEGKEAVEESEAWKKQWERLRRMK